MKLVLSPAKSLDYDSDLPHNITSVPQFMAEAATINAVLAKKKPTALQKLMHISDALAQLNWQRNQDFKSNPQESSVLRPAVYAFNGDVYQGLEAHTIAKEHWDNLQHSVRILSGLYGVLRPFDQIQPYRLEMGTPLKLGRKPNLYEFWKKKVTQSINDELKQGELFVNLASNEYYSVIDQKTLKTNVVSPIFKEWKNDNLKIISFFAKRARGSMARFLITRQIQTVEELLTFNEEGYSYSEEATKNPNQPVFVR